MDVMEIPKTDYQLVLEGAGPAYEDIFNNGLCVGYSEVFGGKLPLEFHFEFQQKTWLVDDQYCMNPSCRCKEALLAFIEVRQDKRPVSPSFAVRVALGTGSYRVEDNDDGRQYEGINAIVDHFMQGAVGVKELLKRRYDEMKARGSELLEDRRLQQERRVGAVPGRNAPCPCGSGKKFKRCCGR